MDDETLTTEDEHRMRLGEARNTSYPMSDEPADDEETATEEESATDEDVDTPLAPKEKRGPRIGPAVAGFMVFVSLFFDGGQFILGLIPVIGIVFTFVLSIFAWLTFFVWFHAKGMSYGASLKGGLSSAGKNPMVINTAMLLIGMIPFVNMLPERTAGIVLVIIFEYADYMTKKSGGGKLFAKAGTR
ncbi:MAG: hypothetical protein A3B37_01330 [Candidatus Sungbacteria bacterium RIFCSPLOWO2_01_FULL_59_16]|uniref:Uncharacterized protein n=1 Tax=Candidatus Sungbacteria bacterium RIFCSPLOWO2_01_FULL_59_16 TaxID=1802280 RepID=A0A1G2LC01_9BACT|nr:MAG: hypothetical protein A3B37_01330 [Candidatus Sungbacteria bacterium RIFCSPLOWO2_01_FULL_59_16]